MNLHKLYQGAIHSVIFIAGLRLFAAPEVSSRDLFTLILAAIVCVALLLGWCRSPKSFGRDPNLAAQILVHGVVILMAALLIQALCQLMASWYAVATIVVAGTLSCAVLLCVHMRLKASALLRYGALACGSVALMGTVAVVLLAWKVIDSSALHQ